MKLSVLINSKTSLENFTKLQIPVEMAWKIKTFINKINPELQAYEEIRTQKVIEYGEKVENNQYNVKPENMEAFFKDIAELQNKEVECIPPVIKLQELLDYSKKLKEPLTISSGDLMLLDWLIVDGEEK